MCCNNETLANQVRRLILQYFFRKLTLKLQTVNVITNAVLY